MTMDDIQRKRIDRHEKELAGCVRKSLVSVKTLTAYLRHMVRWPPSWVSYKNR